jgi:sugar phosphate permease
LILLPLSGRSIVVARVVSGRGWVRWPLILAGLALVLTAAVMLLITHQSSIPILIAMSLLFGFANGFSSFANQATLYAHAPADDMAVAAGLFRTAAYIGAIFSASLIELAFGTAATDIGFHILAWVIGGLGVAASLLGVFDNAIPWVAE